MARVFVIDDDEDLLVMLGLVLQRLGHSPTLFGDPEQGLTNVLAERPDLLILDLMMPHLSGFEVCARIRATPAIADLPIMVLTALANAHDRQRAFNSGASDYVTKPIPAIQLAERIQALLPAV